MNTKKKFRLNYPINEPVQDVVPTYEQLRTKHPKMAGFNLEQFSIPSISKHAVFLILRSASLDNIIKGMKHGLWTSTIKSNAKIDKAFKEAEEVYFLYTVVGSRAFQAVAKLDGPFDPLNTFQHWDEPMKWFGTHPIKCLFLAELQQSILDEKQPAHLGQIILSDQTDCTEISTNLGVFVVQCFKDLLTEDEADNVIVRQFGNVEQRELQIKAQRDIDPNYQQQFDIQQKIFEKAPFEYQTHRHKQHQIRYMQNQADQMMYMHAYNHQGPQQYYQQNQYQQQHYQGYPQQYQQSYQQQQYQQHQFYQPQYQQQPRNNQYGNRQPYGQNRNYNGQQGQYGQHYKQYQQQQYNNGNTNKPHVEDTNNNVNILNSVPKPDDSNA